MASYRRRSRVATRRRSSASGPIVAFLLIASFGILFAGCSNTVKGPNDEQAMQDDTFTADDVARFRDLAGDHATGSGETQSSLPRLDMAMSGSGNVRSVSPIAIDPVLAAKYTSIRTPASAASNSYTVSNEFVNVRETPSSGAASVGRLERGNPVTVIEFQNAQWAKVKLADGKEGYIAARYLSKLVPESKVAEEEKAFANTYFVNFGFVNVRAEPNSGSAKLGEIPGQAFVQPVSIDNGWAKIKYQDKDGYVSMQFLAAFKPPLVVRQDTFQLPVLHYQVDEPQMLQALVSHAQKLKQDGLKLITLRSFFDNLLLQESRNVPWKQGSAVITVSGITPQNVREVSDVLLKNAIPATFFLETQYVGVSGISEKTLLNLSANGFDIQSGGHTGDDLRGLSNAQLILELEQSRALIEDMTHKTVYAVAYPQGGTNDRVLQAAANAGYLLGVSGAPDTSFTRDQLLRLPSLTVTATMTADDISQSIR